MKNKKGFTLIELLAVIVILAIIALIATPIIRNVIENSRKGAAERSAENYIDAVETAVATERLDGKVLEGTYKIQEDGSICPEAGCTIDGIDKKVSIDMSGNKPKSGTIVIENGQVVENLSSDTTKKTTVTTKDDYTVNYNNGKLEATKVETGNTTTTVYRLSEDTINLEQQIVPTDTTKFTTDPTTLGKNYYLKHVIDENNIVKESYVCAVFNGKETCLRGGSPDYYGWSENEADYTGNAKYLKDQFASIRCNFNDRVSHCYDGSVELDAYSDGSVDASGGGGGCSVSGDDGSSYCGGL